MSCNPKPASGRIPIIVGGHSEAAARRAATLGDGFFPATGSSVDIVPLIGSMRRMARDAGRDPAAIEVITGCPGALPGAPDPLKAVAEAAARGVGRVVLPVTAFMQGLSAPAGGPQHSRTFGGLEYGDLEGRLAEFGETVIRQVAGR